MPLMYDRKETSHEIVIKYKFWPLYYIILIVFIFLIFFFSSYFFLTFPVFIILALLFTVGFWKPNAEIKKAMKKGTVKVSGSKFSFTNPLTAVIKKK